jgi:hypothetical protein
MKNSFILIIIFITLYASNNYSGGGEKEKFRPTSILQNDNYRYIAVNNIKMWISNNGDGSYNPNTGSQGFLWPGGENATKGAVYEDGLVFGGLYNGQIRVNGNTTREGLQAGKILPNGMPDDPSLPKYRVYKILKGWENLPPGPLRDQYEVDYNEWPMLDGAPYIDVNGNGIPDPGIDLPDYVGDEVAWYVANDMDSQRSVFTYGTLPMGLEFQTTVFAFKDEAVQDMIFKKYLIINKSNTPVVDMYASYWSDTDIGNPNDDYAGCDSTINLGFVYNGNGSDIIYGIPPALGYDYLQGPKVPGLPEDSARFLGSWRKGFKNLPMTSFVFYMNGSAAYRDPGTGQGNGAVEFYNCFQGLVWNGAPYIDPNTEQETKFLLAGDPLASMGWYEGPGWLGGPPPGERRLLMNAGPFTLNPGDSQEVIFGIIIALGLNNINSIAELKNLDFRMQEFYDNNFIVTDVRDNKSNTIYNLEQNYPNPFNPVTKIKYSVSEFSNVVLKVFNILGTEIAELINEDKSPGTYELIWTAADYPSGIYFYRFQAGDYSQTKKMILLK